MSNYKEHETWLEEQFINGINDEMMTTEIIRELSIIQKMCDITSETSAQLG